MTDAELRALVARLDNLDRRGGLGYDAHDLLRETVNALPDLLDRLAAAERNAERMRPLFNKACAIVDAWDGPMRHPLQPLVDAAREGK